MAIVQEFDNGCILYGLCEVQPEQWSDSEESDNHTTDAEASSVTPDDKQNNCQAEVEPQLPKEEEIPKVQEEQPIEEEIPKVQEEQPIVEQIPKVQEEQPIGEEIPKVQEEQPIEEQIPKVQEELQKEVDLQNEELLQKGKDLQKPEEHHHQPQSMVELLNSLDPQPLEEAEARGNPSGDTQNSESDRNQSDHEHLAVSPPPVLVPQLPWDVLPPGSKAKGVSYHKKNKQWEAHLWIKGRQLRNRKKKGVQIFMGNFRTEDEAKEAHDRAAIKFEVRTSGRLPRPYTLNFHESAQADFIAEHQDWSLRDFLWKLRRYSLKFSSGKSGMKGVTVRTSSRKRRKRGEAPASGETSTSLRYETKIAKTTGRKMTCSVGTYGSEEEAGKAYDRALLFINKDKSEVEKWHVITNFRPSNYTVEEVLVAGKKLFK